ncbi:serine--tRNA ligase, mitochondrial-like [Ctenocephalides felis]|uniref:serine--tRNA ligase, mitochondrial-like n=1 Tax=Ctenocephalides felis TaxID=7515 RepID=UPI000E6E4364|nr:serine--tRNA ligase, mitochondrial-like [Ctenocephalides felis]
MIKAFEGDKERFLRLIEQEIYKLPNDTHPDVIDYNDEPKEVEYIDAKPKFDFKPFDLGDIGNKMNILRTDNLSAMTGPKSYVFIDSLTHLERALILYTVNVLKNNGFKFVSVPDILPSTIIEGCGMSTKGDRNQVYHLSNSHGSNLCLAGTSEISIAGLLAGSQNLNVDDPIKYAAISRCYRAETSGVAQEKGIYRVHQFTKVEMFLCCHPNESSKLLDYIIEIQKKIITPLGIHVKILDMPPHELGAPAYRKYDMEAWMPGRNMWGEISSCSNCTDYQSRRLAIKFEKNGSKDFVHTLNGTACAVPRLLIAFLETHQKKDGTISLPKALVPFMNNCDKIKRMKRVPDIKFIKNLKV